MSRDLKRGNESYGNLGEEQCGQKEQQGYSLREEVTELWGQEQIMLGFIGQN